MTQGQRLRFLLRKFLSIVKYILYNLCIWSSCTIFWKSFFPPTPDELSGHSSGTWSNNEITRRDSCVLFAVLALGAVPHITFVLWILQQQIQLSNISADKQVNVTLQRAQVTFNEAFFISLCRWLVEWQLSKDLTWILDTGYWQYVQPTGTNSLQNQLVGKTFFGISVISWTVIC